MSCFYYGVDGTGPYSDSKYESHFQNSFVNRLGREISWTQSGYERGPALDGIATKPSGTKAAETVAGWMKVARNAQQNGTMTRPAFLVLAGYSRGGAAIIHACNSLKQKGISVDMLLLFDAVDRAIFLNDVMQVPNNVKRVAHARRDPNTLSRVTFGNCGTSLQGPGGDSCSMAYKEKSFAGTHGAVGGVPWTQAQPESSDDKSWTDAVKPSPPLAFKILKAARDHKQTKDIASGKRQAGLIEEHPFFATNVTYSKDQEVVREVAFWMRSELRSAMGVTTGVLPGNGRAYA